MSESTEISLQPFNLIANLINANIDISIERVAVGQSIMEVEKPWLLLILREVFLDSGHDERWNPYLKISLV